MVLQFKHIFLLLFLPDTVHCFTDIQCMFLCYYYWVIRYLCLIWWH